MRFEILRQNLFPTKPNSVIYPVISYEFHGSSAPENKSTVTRSDFYAKSHISYKMVFGLPALKVRFCAPLSEAKIWRQK